MLYNLKKMPSISNESVLKLRHRLDQAKHVLAFVALAVGLFTADFRAWLTLVAMLMYRMVDILGVLFFTISYAYPCFPLLAKPTPAEQSATVMTT